MLYLISTPIGNLGDFSFRAVATIKTCDYLLCEDTRHSRILLNAYELSLPLKSFHQFNEHAKEASVLQDLQDGKIIGLLSDAGTPLISDPGANLIKKCRELGIKVFPIPGPCSPIAALSASGLRTDRFQFLGFLPKKKGRLERVLEEALSYPGTTIFFESPHRISKSLPLLAEKCPERTCVLAREITKKFETFLSGSAAELVQKIAKVPLKGEIVFMIEGTLEK